jgi:serine/threonine protein kinase
MTKTSAAMGSPLYMSPEQMHSAKDVDQRGDIWALGIVLYELVSGCAPFQGETMAALVLKVVSAAPTPLSEVCALAPPGLEAVVLKCLQKDRSARYQSVAELAVALHEFGPRHSKASVERIGRVMQRAGLAAGATQLPDSAERADTLPSVSAPRTMATWGQTNPPVNRRRRVALIAAALLGVPRSGRGALGRLRSSAHGATLASSRLAGASGSPAPQAEKSVPVAAPAASAPVVEPNSEVASAPPAVSAASPATHSALSAATNARPRSAPLHTSLHAVAPASPLAVAKPAAPPAAKNPLKMPIQ